MLHKPLRTRSLALLSPVMKNFALIFFAVQLYKNLELASFFFAYVVTTHTCPTHFMQHNFPRNHRNTAIYSFFGKAQKLRPAIEEVIRVAGTFQGYLGENLDLNPRDFACQPPISGRRRARISPEKFCYCPAQTSKVREYSDENSNLAFPVKERIGK